MRRIHLPGINWRYSLGELAIVVVGILIALLRMMEPGAAPTAPSEVTVHLNSALVAWTFNPSDGVLQDLLNSGRLHLIRNDRLRSKLAAWPGRVADLAEDEAANKMILDEQLLPFLMRTAPLKMLGHYAEATGEEAVSRFPWDPGRLLTSMEFESHLVNRLTVVTLDILAEARPLLADRKAVDPGSKQQATGSRFGSFPCCNAT